MTGRTKPYKVITTDDPNLTLGEGRKRHYETLLAAANAFAKDPAQYKQILWDNGLDLVRELDEREQALLADVCEMLGLDVEPID
jgi:hypothetical protein